MKRILVTGGDGQLALSLREIVADKDNEYVFVNREELDITDHNKVSSFIESNNFDFCINCAGYTNVEKAESEVEKSFEINEKAVSNLAKACNKNDIVLIHISTDYVFEGLSDKPYKEEDIANPINVYGKSKLAGELELQKQIDKYYIIRTSWIYSQFGSNFVKTMLRLSKEKDEIQVVSDQIGTPTYAKDLSLFIVYLINNNSEYGIYNYSGLGSTSWFGFVNEIYKLKNITTKVCSKQSDKRVVKRPRYSVLDKSKVLKDFKIKKWEDSLASFLKIYE
ncbi:MAG: dTDP-4-dehydrorhamnose reductase [Flavobacteriaceae bacterium]|nr:dTDP-4-dehydrorhamnose reductase [Flavobacteriaceae bacterium]